ncbi:MAG: D-glycero-beta-D-manno-heptose-7-phosphate kinase [Candidatus Omnitrophica bacterium]|nr:D-glycero-beta-D-manno-heptose-7-phosphate kinase [Candidatus Omnitrophota bacterium]
MPAGKAKRVKTSDKKRLSEIVDNFKKARVLVVGDFILDQFVWGTVSRISPEAPVPVVNVDRESYMPGGSLNVANNIRALKATVYPCGVIGRDLAGRVLLKAMRREGIDTGGIVYDRNRPTALKTRIIAHSQQMVRFDREKVGDISREDIQSIVRFIQKRIMQTDIVIIEDYGKGVIQPSLVREVLKVSKKHKKPVLVDPKEKHFSYYKGVTGLTPNRKEAFEAYMNGRRDAHQPTLNEVGNGLLKKLQSDSLLITLGEDGMALFEKRGGVTMIPTAAREVYDVSGAGDTVIAVFAAALACGAKMKEAAILSNMAAGIAVAKLGTATVSDHELREAVKSS